MGLLSISFLKYKKAEEYRSFRVSSALGHLYRGSEGIHHDAQYCGNQDHDNGRGLFAFPFFYGKSEFVAGENSAYNLPYKKGRFAPQPQ